MNSYKALQIQKIVLENYSIVPIRFQDRYLIMKWRNEQMFHLRQEKLLTNELQDLYFNNILSKNFEQENPEQILFSYLKFNECIGYGGLVHINWKDRNAEISFIMQTELEYEKFEFHWKNFLTMINLVAMKELNLIKIYTYAYDLRPLLYNVLEDNGYKLEARLRKHKFIGNKFVDVLIHSKIND
jgi:RimJ/RimL family protein N-acetyltransferase